MVSANTGRAVRRPSPARRAPCLLWSGHGATEWRWVPETGENRLMVLTAKHLPDFKPVQQRIRSPIGVVMGSPAEVSGLVAEAGAQEITCYQMDLHQAERLREELDLHGLQARVVTTPDLWDLAADFQTVLYPAPQGGERELKLDMVEQAYHVLLPRGVLVVLSAHAKDQLFPVVLKKVFGRFHAPAVEGGQVLWAAREGDRPRRRHEVTFHANMGDGVSLCFLSRPGVFSYGRFDNGARALVEVMEVKAGDR